jgi:RNA polymerase sigma-70 factor (ECF subfamily)
MLSLTQPQAVPSTEAGAADQPIAALAAHDTPAWQGLFDEYYRKMYSFAYVRTGDASAAEEIAAEVFVAAAKGIVRYRPTGAPFAAWLYRIARNLTADHLEHRRKRPSVPLDDVEIATTGWDAGIEDATDIARAMSHLTREQQEIITLRFFSDCSLQEAAAALGKSLGAVKVLQHRALAAMRRQMTNSDSRREGRPSA